MSMQLKTKTFLFMVLAFILGGIGGGFIGRTYFPLRPERQNFMQYFSNRLKLTPAQSIQVDTLLSIWGGKNRELVKPYRKYFDELRQLERLNQDSLRAEIRKLLTSEQNVLFDAYIKEQNEREARRR